MTVNRNPRVIVFGAGAFGGWTALELVRRRAAVTLVDAWGPGNVRASSGGETRIIRAAYGARTIYTRMAARALHRGRAHDAQFQRGLFRRTGVLWMFGAADPFMTASVTALTNEGVPLEQIAVNQARRRFPQIDFDRIAALVLETDGGFLLARRAWEHVVERLIAEGGDYVQASAAVPFRSNAHGESVTLDDGRELEADVFVFACGPWLGTLFPDVVGPLIASTRQEVYYFGPPAGDPRFSEQQCPTWIEVGPERVFYGIPGNVNRGFKIADDTSGPPFDPTCGDRGDTTPAGVAAARAFIAARFPALADAPLVGTEVCQYESTPDAHFLIDRHPELSNVWIVGGGSGHGFKMGPAVGEMLADLILRNGEPDPAFRLARFAQPPPGGWDQKWSS